jgi:hypothetical protein
MTVQGRIRWEVAPVPGSLLWSVSREGAMVDRRFFKYRAVEAARAACRFELEVYNARSELLVKNRHGRYTSEGSTYGDDPREVRG